MPLIYIIEDEPVMADCLALAVRQFTLPEPKVAAKNRAGLPDSQADTEVFPEVEIFYDALAPMAELSNRLPDAILLDVMLTGPDGFTFLNELLSYEDTARIPVVLISSLDLSGRNLEHYGVVQYLDKATMTPEDINVALRKALSTDSPRTVAGEASQPSPTENITSGPTQASAQPLSGLAALNEKISALNEKTAAQNEKASALDRETAVQDEKASAQNPAASPAEERAASPGRYGA